jgi:hypothetical protein
VFVEGWRIDWIENPIDTPAVNRRSWATSLHLTK